MSDFEVHPPGTAAALRRAQTRQSVIPSGARLRPVSYVAAAKRIERLAALIRQNPNPTTWRELAALSRRINALAYAANDLRRRHLAL